MKTKNKNNKTSKSSAGKSDDRKVFPGYPKYAASEDITNRAERVDADLEDPSFLVKDIVKYPIAGDTSELDPDDKTPVKNEFDVTKDDLKALGSDGLNTDDGDDELLKQRTTPVDFSGSDLDIPGADDDDSKEAVGSEDEENNSYSLGGEDHKDLEEDKS
jgi:hypothetical protein